MPVGSFMESTGRARKPSTAIVELELDDELVMEELEELVTDDSADELAAEELKEEPTILATLKLLDIALELDETIETMPLEETELTETEVDSLPLEEIAAEEVDVFSAVSELKELDANDDEPWMGAELWDGFPEFPPPPLEQAVKPNKKTTKYPLLIFFTEFGNRNPMKYS